MLQHENHPPRQALAIFLIRVNHANTKHGKRKKPLNYGTVQFLFFCHDAEVAVLRSGASDGGVEP